jgi:hypothetical protein
MKHDMSERERAIAKANSSLRTLSLMQTTQFRLEVPVQLFARNLDSTESWWILFLLFLSLPLSVDLVIFDKTNCESILSSATVISTCDPDTCEHNAWWSLFS